MRNERAKEGINLCPLKQLFRCQSSERNVSASAVGLIELGDGELKIVSEFNNAFGHRIQVINSLTNHSDGDRFVDLTNELRPGMRKDG